MAFTCDKLIKMHVPAGTIVLNYYYIHDIFFYFILDHLVDQEGGWVESTMEGEVDMIFLACLFLLTDVLFVKIL
jgi:hypothetical protein